MYLNTLRLKGFKSFADETSITFSRGINCIVGPNGCGKSNIVDALKWVIGDSSLKGMRASNLKDMIFKGTESRRGSRTAEVTVSLLREDYLLPGGDNLVVTRRIKPDGESEFFIDNKKARLKDIQSLFLEIGVGNKNYIFFEQGQIDRILRLKPEERRVLIDEAAGITRFREKKAETLKKLEEATLNLEALRQIIGEVSRNLRSLKIQADRAKRLEELKKLESELELKFNGYKLRKLLEGKEKISVQNRELKEKRNAAEEDIRVIKSYTADMEKELAELNEKISEVMDEFHELEKSKKEQAVRLEFLIKEEKRIRAEIKNIHSETSHRHNLIERLREEINDLSRGKKDIEDAIASTEGELRTREQNLKEKEVRKLELNHQIESAGKELSSMLSTISKINVDIAREKERLRGMEETRKELPSELESLRKELNYYMSELDESVELAEKVDGELQSVIERKKKVEKELSETKTLYRTLSEKLQKLREKKAYIESRIKSIQDISSYIGGERLEKAIAESGMKGKVRGYIGFIANLIKVDDGWESIVGAYLDQFGAGIVVKTFEDIIWIKERIKGSGRVMILSADVKPIKNRYFENATPLLSHVKPIDTRTANLINVIFSNVFFTSSDAHKLAKENPDCVFIDRNLNVFSGRGSVIGGISQASRIIEVEKEVEKLKKELASVESESQDAEQEIKSVNRKLDILSGELDAITKKENELKIKKVEFSSAEKELRRRVEELEAHIGRLQERLSEARGAGKDIHLKIEMFEKKLKELDADRQNISKTLNQMKSEEAAVSAEIEQEKGELSTLKSKLAILKEKLSNINHTLSAKKTSLRQAEQESNRLTTKEDKLKKELERTLEEIEDIKQMLSGIEETMDDVKEELASFETRKSKLLSILRERKNSLKEKEKALRDIMKRLNENEIELAKITTREDDITSKILSLNRSVSEAIEAAADIKSEEEIRKKLAETKEKISRIGAVNYLAAQEYERLKERYGFIMDQERDLTKSIKDLKKAIEMIDKEIAEKFEKTFRGVNRAFRDVFRRVFGGGKAKLILTGSDPIEGGIEIEAKPPGKKHSSINHLSGGERTLVALSLLYAFYAVRPAPFVVLDEVDASLDEENTVRFNELLKELSEKTQVIIVTHNKLTMETADVLYGVTMEIPGISRVVGVSFQT